MAASWRVAPPEATRVKTPRKKATRESRQKVTTARSSADDEIDARVDVLADRLAPFVTRLRTLQERARSLGVFPNDRDLLTCPSRGLAEDVLPGGQLITSATVGRRRTRCPASPSRSAGRCPETRARRASRSSSSRLLPVRTPALGRDDRATFDLRARQEVGLCGGAVGEWDRRALVEPRESAARGCAAAAPSTNGRSKAAATSHLRRARSMRAPQSPWVASRERRDAPARGQAGCARGAPRASREEERRIVRTLLPHVGQ